MERVTRGTPTITLIYLFYATGNLGMAWQVIAAISDSYIILSRQSFFWHDSGKTKEQKTGLRGTRKRRFCLALVQWHEMKGDHRQPVEPGQEQLNQPGLLFV
jgi:hypothetical protein